MSGQARVHEPEGPPVRRGGPQKIYLTYEPEGKKLLVHGNTYIYRELLKFLARQQGKDYSYVQGPRMWVIHDISREESDALVKKLYLVIPEPLIVYSFVVREKK